MADGQLGVGTPNELGSGQSWELLDDGTQMIPMIVGSEGHSAHRTSVDATTW